MSRRQILALLDNLAPPLRAAFLEVVNDIKDRAKLSRIIEALEAKNIEGAIQALGLDRTAMAPFLQATAAAYSEAGARLVVRFDVGHPRAAAWLIDHSSTLVTRILDDQREAIRLVLHEGMNAGRNPRNVALDIIGRINRQTGRREGGIVGLTKQQAEFVVNARTELLSGDSTQLRNYLARTRRDRRFDDVVKRAIETESPIDPKIIDRMTSRYSDRLLQLRGESIARTEALTSLNAAQTEGLRQAVEERGIDPSTVTRIWRTAGDNRVRDSHAAINGESVGLDETFSNGLQYPGDPSGPPEETIFCRCWVESKIDFLAGIA